MTLHPEHLAYLQARGINPDQMQGRYFSDGAHLAIRYLDPQDNAYKDSKGHHYLVRRLFPTGKPKFVAPTASGSRPYFSPLMPDGYLTNISIPLVLLEGPAKADSCFSHIPTGYCFVALTGTWNTKDKRDENGNWDAENNSRILPELKAIPMNGRKTITLFDSDIEDKPGVSDAAADIGNWTRQRGAKPHRCVMPSEPDGAKNGADDFLVRHGPDALVELLESAVVEGWPLPAPLLDGKGELKRSYTPSEESRLFNVIAGLTDHHMVDSLIRKLFRRLGMSRTEMARHIEDARDGLTERGLFGDPSELDAPDIDNRWIFPGILLKGEVIILSGLSGTGKTLLAYAMASAARRGGTFLGMAVPKMRVCILQLEEGGSFGRRMKAFGFTKDECGVGKSWNFIRSFNPLKASDMQMFKTQVQPHYDFFVLDSIREMSAGSGLNEALAEFSQQLIRPLVKLFRTTDKGMVVLDHNAKGTDQIAGGDDKRAAVWGVFNMRKANEHSENNITISSHQAHGGKSRDSDAIHWELQWEKEDSPAPGEDAYKWRLVADLRPDCIDLNLLTRVLALLESYPEPITLREIGERLGLRPDGSKVNSALRQLAAKSPALRRYRIEDTKPATYFMPMENRHPALKAGCIYPPLKKEEKEKPCIDTNGSQGFHRVSTDFETSGANGSQGFHEVSASGEKASLSNEQGFQGEQGNHLKTHLNPGQDSRVSTDPLNALGTYMSPPAPTLNGHTDALWQLADTYPDLAANTLALKFQAACGVVLTGAQVQQLLAKGRPKATDSVP